jgi:AcrR family transcriptional regulator
MPKVLPEYLELRRQQILDAAAGCFTRKGFHHSTMQDICDQAELSPGAVYRYFRSKEEIIEAMSDYRQRQNGERLQQAMSKQTTLAIFDELLNQFFLNREADELQDSCAMMIELVAEAPRNERIRESQSRINSSVLQAMTEIIQNSQATGEIEQTLDAQGVARVMTALYQGFVIQRMLDPDLDVVAYTRAARALFGGEFWRANEATPSIKSHAALRH